MFLTCYLSVYHMCFYCFTPVYCLFIICCFTVCSVFTECSLHRTYNKLILEYGSGAQDLNDRGSDRSDTSENYGDSPELIDGGADSERDSGSDSGSSDSDSSDGSANFVHFDEEVNR